MLVESLDRVRRLWRGEAVELENGAGGVSQLRTLPRPLQPELPIWLTSSGSASTFELAGKAAIERMHSVLTVAMAEFTYHDADWSNGVTDGFSVAFAFQNKGARDLAGAKGAVRFADMFDDQIKLVGLSMDDGIPAGKTIMWKGQLDYNQFIDSDKRLRNTATEELKVSWVPRTYLFSDGTRMDAPE